MSADPCASRYATFHHCAHFLSLCILFGFSSVTSPQRVCEDGTYVTSSFFCLNLSNNAAGCHFLSAHPCLPKPAPSGHQQVTSWALRVTRNPLAGLSCSTLARPKGGLDTFYRIVPRSLCCQSHNRTACSKQWCKWTSSYAASAVRVGCVMMQVSVPEKSHYNPIVCMSTPWKNAVFRSQCIFWRSLHVLIDRCCCRPTMTPWASRLSTTLLHTCRPEQRNSSPAAGLHCYCSSPCIPLDFTYQSLASSHWVILLTFQNHLRLLFS